MPVLRGNPVVAGIVAVALACAACLHAAAEEPALLLPRATESLLLDVARAGERLVAVGERGHVLISADEGRSWRQLSVPTRSMLTAVWFVDDRTGWVVGHDGVVLATRDGGASWDLQREGLVAQRELDEAEVGAARTHFEELQGAAAETEALEEARLALEDAEATLAEPVFAPPLFDVYFRDARHGLAVGAYGSCIVTADGGAHWEDARGRFDNPEQSHLYAIAAAGGGLLVAGESGRMFHSVDGGVTWAAVDSGHHGTFFGLLASRGGESVHAFGLQGALLWSEDAGTHWRALDAGTAVVLAGGTLDAGGTPWIVGSMGTVLRADRTRIERLPDGVSRAHLSSAIATVDGALVVVGQGGARRLVLPQPGSH
jgi:photosystem II stability/assembly factor-like uncharacterized protein